jgi:hypothetical protein
VRLDTVQQPFSFVWASVSAPVDEAVGLACYQLIPKPECLFGTLEANPLLLSAAIFGHVARYLELCPEAFSSGLTTNEGGTY